MDFRAPAARVRLACALVVILAVIVWNVVFDHVIVVAGREYLTAAVVAAHGTGQYARMDDWMRPAVTRAFWTASVAAVLILSVGFLLIRVARRRAAQGPEPI